jgi:hypothetical protein
MIKSLGLVAALLVATACGGGSSKKPDANTAPSEAGADASNCTSIAIGAQDLQDPGDGTYVYWGAPVTTDLGDGGTADLSFQFYSGIEPSLMGTFDLSMGNQNNYSTCAVCLVLGTTDSSGMPARAFFQTSGSVTLATDPVSGRQLTGSTSGVNLVEVTIDSSTYVSTPVAGGECLTLPDTTLSHNGAPNGYTCAAATYSDGTTCDCACGVLDADCFIEGAPVNGCPGQVCSANACANAVANDTCQTAVALTIGTPVTGTTVGATSNYDSGLEGATCTTVPQAGGDVAYKVTLAAGTGYTFTLSNVDPTFDASISLVGPGAAAVCDADPIATCVAGADLGLEGDGETFSYTVPTGQGGTYYVIVDSFYPAPVEAGAFTVEVTSP